MTHLFECLRRQAHEPVKKRERLAALNYLLRVRTVAVHAEVALGCPQLLRKLRAMGVVA